VILGKGALALHGGDHTRAQVFGQRAQFLPALREQDAAARHNHGALGLEQQVRGLRDRGGIASGAPMWAARARLGYFVKIDDIRLHVHRQRDQRGAGSTRVHRVEGLSHGALKLDRRVDVPGTLDRRVQDARHVGPILALDLLQDPNAAHVGMRLADQQQQGDRIHVSCGQADRRVGRARPDGGEDRQRLALDTVVPVGHVDRRLLVAGHDDLDAILVAPEGIHERQIAVARNANGIRDSLFGQHIGDDLRTRQFHVEVPPNDSRSSECDGLPGAAASRVAW